MGVFSRVKKHQTCIETSKLFFSNQIITNL